MGWLFMSRGGMAPFATPKAYLDNQCTYPPDPEKGRETGLRVLKSTVRSGAYDARAALGLTVLGVPAVLLAAYIVKELPLDTVRWLVLAVVVYTAASMLLTARSESRRCR